jgi:serine/threonine-protein kinase HipA
MTREALDVRIESVDDVAGTLVREDGQLGFAYRPAYLAAPGALPFSVRLPLRDGPFDARTTRHFFANLLPEGRLLDQKARRLDLEPDDVFGLLRHFGAETAGALSVLPVDSPPVKRPGRFPDDYRPISDEELRAIVADLEGGRTVSIEGAADPSLAGVQMKVTLVVAADESLHAPVGTAPTTHILKVADPAMPGLVENEHFCMRLAGRVGLEAAETEVRPVGASRVLLVRRYDRRILDAGAEVATVRPGSVVHRLHQEDFAQAMGVPSAAKYSHRGGPSFEATVRSLGVFVSDRLEFRRRMVDALLFAAVIGNWDAHLKNFSFLHLPATEGGVRLAPLYDLLSVRLYPRFRQGLALSVGGRQDHGTVDGAAWLSFRKEVGLNAAYLRDRARVLLPAIAREAVALREMSGFTAFYAGEILKVIGDEGRALADALGFEFDAGFPPFISRGGGWQQPS